ncbi:hybrid sensor histidine kinase/response regulator [Natrialba swarupiae]|uniref:histidine kinase n=1 Tax=Natrialba swarupiae TaxID=2448032 RepID=A0A5D5ALD3_9EURY|nr:hybrid sensor histidine kinase/response regulator [Natrialba swarupiae]TYT62688.1 PAS domain-containing protein [Natrialba swarupiae]
MAPSTGGRSCVDPLENVDVLCVDDDPSSARLTQAYLERRHHEFDVRIEHQTADALERLETDRFDCVVSDYDMPEMNGLEFLNMVRDSFGEIPFILFTGKGSEEIASEAISAGVTDYLRKETGKHQYDVLANHVRNAVESNRRRRTLERSRALFETTFDDPDRLIAVLDPDGTVRRANRRLSTFVGVETDDLVGHRYWELPWPRAFEAAAPDLAEWLERATAGRRTTISFEYSSESGEPVTGEETTESLVTEHVFVEAVAQPVTIDGAVGALVVDVHDASTAVTWEREVELKDAAFDAAPVGMTITDPSLEDNPIVYANAAFERLTGYPHEEVLGRNCRFLQGEGTNPEPVDAMREAVDAEEPVTVELTNYRKDGTTFHNEVTIAPIRDADGTVTHFVGFQNDITDRRTAYDRLERERDRLEEFASVLSHDLRNPLTAAMGYGELVREDCSSPFLDDIEAAHEQIERLIDETLALARAGSVVGSLEPVSLSELAVDSWQTVDSGDGSLEVVDDEQFLADPGRSRQLFENLFRNSLEHGVDSDGQGDGPAVTVTVGPLGDGFFLEDDGPGIAPAERDRVFERGYTTSEEGIGLGLRIVEEIATGHGWTVAVLEGGDGGARFEITGVDRP